VLALTLALGAALLWGISDFSAGFQSRRHPLPLVTTASQGAGLLVLTCVVLVVWPPVPSVDAFAVAVFAGVAMAVGVIGFYGAMAAGTISVAAPIASTGIAIPVVFGLIQGERPRGVQIAGILFAIVGVLLVSRSPQKATAVPRRTILLALVGAVGFGSFFVGMDEAGQTDANLLWLLLGARAAAFLTLCGLTAVQRPSLQLSPRTAGLLVAIGITDLAANGCFLLAASKGLLSLVSVLGSLYALVTVLLARGFLAERVSRVQGAGIVFSLGGAALIALAT
jgi:drug/metabolite transporter (DMT)-like permease